MKTTLKRESSTDISPVLLNGDKKEIIDLFDRYDFKDSHGHSLTNCLDFQHLVDLWINSRQG